MIDYKVKVWNKEKLGAEICFDVETTVAPFHTREHKLVVFQAYDGGDTVYLVNPKDVKYFFNKHYTSKFIAQNAKFDMEVILPYIGKDMLTEILDQDRIFDTKILYALLHLASIGYVPSRRDCSLKSMSRRLLNRDIDKNNDIRLTFGQFLDKSYSEMPQDHLKYAAEDVIHTFDLYCKLLAMIKPYDHMGTLLSHHIQIKGDWGIDQMRKNGIGIDLGQVNTVRTALETTLETYTEKLAMWGWVRGKPGINNIFENIVKRLGLFDKLPKTETGKISSSAEELEPFFDQPFLSEYVAFQQTEKNINFLKPLDSSVIHADYNYLVNTGRTSCARPNFQNLPRLGGVRECFVPKSKDNVLVAIDYSALELATLAQVNITNTGYSKMGDLINEGQDLHTYFAKNVYGVDEVSKDQRQFAKVFNFGLGSNMGAATFVDYAKPQGLTLTESEAQTMKDVWLDTFPEMVEFFQSPYNSSQNITLTGRVRGDCSYTAFLNTQFQGLAADGAKLALYNAWKVGLEVVGFCHDELVFECPRDKADFTLAQGSDIMIQSMETVTPDVTIRVEGKILERYEK